MKNIRIVLAEDHAVVRAGLGMLLRREEDLEVVGEAQNGEEAVTLTRKLRPDIVVMDISLPVMNGIEATLHIRKEFPDTKVLVLSSCGEDEMVAQLLENGASSYLLKQSTANNLVQGIRQTHAGQAIFSGAIATRRAKLRADAFIAGTPSTRLTPHLTCRETEVLRLISEGYPGKLIADAMGISAKTVEKHRQQVMNKLNIHQIAGLTRYAVSRGLVC